MLVAGAGLMLVGNLMNLYSRRAASNLAPQRQQD